MYRKFKGIESKKVSEGLALSMIKRKTTNLNKSPNTDMENDHTYHNSSIILEIPTYYCFCYYMFNITGVLNII